MNADPVNARAMSAYMKNQFPFFGVKAPLRRALMKASIPPAATWQELVECVSLCYAGSERELHHAAIDLLGKNTKVWTSAIVDLLESLVLTHSWWDTVDGLASLSGRALARFPEHSERPDSWIEHQSFWLQRVALIYQLQARERTDTERLARYIETTMASKEFFLRKAIGWALRQYGYTDPAWVWAFVESHRSQLAPLSIREATRALRVADGSV